MLTTVKDFIRRVVLKNTIDPSLQESEVLERLRKALEGDYSFAFVGFLKEQTELGTLEWESYSKGPSSTGARFRDDELKTSIPLPTYEHFWAEFVLPIGKTEIIIGEIRARSSTGLYAVALFARKSKRIPFVEIYRGRPVHGLGSELLTLMEQRREKRQTGDPFKRDGVGTRAVHPRGPHPQSNSSSSEVPLAFRRLVDEIDMNDI